MFAPLGRREEGERMEKTLEVRQLRKRYGQVEAVKGISFDVGKGEVFAPVSYTHLDVYKRQVLSGAFAEWDGGEYEAAQ